MPISTDPDVIGYEPPPGTTKPPKRPTNAPMEDGPPVASTTGSVPSVPAPSSAAVAGVPAAVTDGIGMLTGALTTVEGLFGQTGGDIGIGGPTDQQLETMELLGLSDEEKRKVLADFTPERAKALNEAADVVRNPERSLSRGTTTGSGSPVTPEGGGLELAPLQDTPGSEEEQRVYDRRVRAAAIGGDLQGPHMPGRGIGVGETREIKLPKFEKFNEDQQAAIEFNTALNAAVQRDLKLQDKYNPDDDQQSRYDKALKQMFGDASQSTEYMPETVAFLSQLGWEDDTSKLADFTNMNMAVDRKELRALGDRAPDMGDNMIGTLQTAVLQAVQDVDLTETERALAAINRSLVDRTQEVKTNLLESGVFAGDERLTLKNDRQEHIGLLGGRERGQKALPGFGTDPMSVHFKAAMSALADKKNQKDIDTVQADITKALKETYGPDGYDKFLEYLDTQTAYALQYNQPLNVVEGSMFLDPDQLRKRLNLDRKAN